MNSRLTTFVLVLAMIVILGVSSTGAAPEAVAPAAVQQVADAGDYDFTTYGTAWVPEIIGQFSWWHPRGWGMQAKSKLVADRWVHIPIPYPSRIAGSLMKIKYIEFCAKSANGAAGTGPNRIDYYSDGGMFHSSAITWWADNAYHCWGYTLATPTWYGNLGISVRLHFSNVTDLITLYKAWVRVAP